MGKLTKLPGHIEIDHDRGVIYFHADLPRIEKEEGADKVGEILEKYGVTVFRICRLPRPIPERTLDVTHMTGADWSPDMGSVWKKVEDKCNKEYDTHEIVINGHKVEVFSYNKGRYWAYRIDANEIESQIDTKEQAVEKAEKAAKEMV